MSAVRQRLRRHVPATVRMRLRPPPAWTVHQTVVDSPFELVTAPTAPVLDEADLDQHGLRLVADPFALHVDGGWYLFVEALERGRRIAGIALLTSRSGNTWDYHGLVLQEPFHLSYPFVFAADDDYWMVPESYAAGEVRLYRATDFPGGWSHDTTLLTGAPFKDASPFHHGGHWWLFVETSSHQHDELRLYRAAQVRGPWREHPASPIVRADAAIARPAGRPFVADGRLYRPAQDCSTSYGRAVHAIEVLELTPSTYRERRAAGPLLVADGTGWNGGGTHHVDAHRVDGRWTCFVDGHR